jgi:hypothetical protein
MPEREVAAGLLSANSKTAFLALGSVNCPAASRACSSRSSHWKTSFDIDGTGLPSCIRSAAKLDGQSEEAPCRSARTSATRASGDTIVSIPHR